MGSPSASRASRALARLREAIASICADFAALHRRNHLLDGDLATPSTPHFTLRNMTSSLDNSSALRPSALARGPPPAAPASSRDIRAGAR